MGQKTITNYAAEEAEVKALRNCINCRDPKYLR